MVFSHELGAAETAATRHKSARAEDELDEVRAPAVLVRRDAHVPSLEHLYDGPNRVLSRSRN
jgi:hypothetical protein